MHVYRRWLRSFGAATLVMLAAVAGAAAPRLAEATEHYPGLRPGIVQDERAQPAPAAELQELAATLSSLAGIGFRVALIDSTDGEDPSDYVEGLFRAWGMGAGEVLILYVAADGRFRAMSGVPGISGEVITRHALEVFVPMAAEGRVLAGIAAFAQAAHSEQAALSPPEPAPQTPPPPEPQPAAPAPAPAPAPVTVDAPPADDPDDAGATERRRGFPWGLMLALVVVLGALTLAQRARRQKRRQRTRRKHGA